MSYDLVIRGGTVVDGSGGPSYRADVGIVGDRIAAIGHIDERGIEELDAEGHLVTPGFIEIHTHLDAQVFWDSLGTCSAWHGVTTAVMGNCGFTLAPCREAEADLCLRNLERAEDMDRAVLLAGVNWSWETYPEYLDAVDRLPKGINYASMIGHSALRTWIMGERAFTEAASEDDLRAMRNQLEAGLRAGAVGFSTSRLNDHRTSDDRPVASRLASWDEVTSLVDVLKQLGVGIFQLANAVSRDPAERARENGKIADIAVESGRVATFPWVFSDFAPDLDREYSALGAEVARRGGRLVGQAIAREFTSVLSFRTNLPFDSLPGWSDLRRKPLEEQRRVLSDPETRASYVQEALNGEYRPGVSSEPRPPVWDHMRVVDFPGGTYPSVAEVARARGTTPVDVVIDLSLERDFQQFFAQPIANQNMDKVLGLLRDPHSVLGLTDSGAHVTQILDTSLLTFLLAYWVRTRQAFSWEEGIRMLTFDPATTMGFSDRGLLREGLIADIAVIDPERVGPAKVEVANDLPAGGKRLKQKATGIAATIVGGTILMRDGEHTGEHPGKLLRGPLAP